MVLALTFFFCLSSLLQYTVKITHFTGKKKRKREGKKKEIFTFNLPWKIDRLSLTLFHQQSYFRSDFQSAPSRPKICFENQCVKSVCVRSFTGPYFPAFRTEHGEIRIISPYSVQMRKNTDQKNFEYGHFSRSEIYSGFSNISIHSYFYLLILDIFFYGFK